MKTERKNSQRVKKITVIALFCALSFVASLIFPIKISFLTLDIKDAVSAVCGMFFGPIAGLACAIIVPLIEFTFSDTGAYGLIMNLLSSIAFVGMSALIYKYKHSIVGAVAALASGAVATVAVMTVANLFITPYYMGVAREQVAALIPTLILPFNAVKTLLNASITMLVYKPISRLLKKLGVGGATAEPINSQNVAKRSVATAVISGIVLVASLVVIFLVLGGKIA